MQQAARGMQKALTSGGYANLGVEADVRGEADSGARRSKSSSAPELFEGESDAALAEKAFYGESRKTIWRVAHDKKRIARKKSTLETMRANWRRCALTRRPNGRRASRLS